MDDSLKKILIANKGDTFSCFCDYVIGGFNAAKTINEILNNLDSTDAYNYLSSLAWFFNVELQGRNFGEEFHFEVSKFSESFQRFLYSWDRLGRKRVPNEEWSDFIEEGIDLLKTLIDEKKLEQFKEDPRYRDFMKRFIRRHEDLRLSGKYPDLNELMDD